LWPDVPDNSYYQPALDWATAVGVEDREPSDGFQPDDSTTRSQAVLWLWRAVGEPQPTAPHGYSDVDADSAYETAVSWATEHGILSGVNGLFQPDGTISRAQWPTMMHRVASNPAVWEPSASKPTTTLFD
jgi:hypothetical protein